MQHTCFLAATLMHGAFVCSVSMMQLEITQFTSVLLYFGYMSMMAFTFFLVTGTIGFLSTLAFVHKIYGSIKVD